MRSRTTLMASIIGAFVIVAGCAVSYEVGKTSTSPPAFRITFIQKVGNWRSDDVPVRTCNSSYGVNFQNLHTPRTRHVTPPTGLAKSLSFYTDSKHTLTPILGPAGWKCSATEGADGSSDISIYPPGVRDPNGAANGTEETMGIEETVYPACVGCMAQLACPIFLNAETQLGYKGQFCPGYMPSSESVRFLEGNAESNFGVALLYDPPGRPGTVALSGSDYPTRGALIYSSGKVPSAESIGCVLPSSRVKFCDAVIDDFVKTFAEINP